MTSFLSWEKAFLLLQGKDNLLATKYMLYLPSEEELRRELERERLIIESKLENAPIDKPLI